MKKVKFKVGDKIVGNAKADKAYAITQKGWKGTVTYVSPGGKHINARDKDQEWTALNPQFFDKVVTKPRATKKYEVDEAFILEGYKVADSTMKEKLKEQFPEVFKARPIEFGSKFTLDMEAGKDIFIGNGWAPEGLQQKCLFLGEGVSVEVKKHGRNTMLVFTKDI